MLVPPPDRQLRREPIPEYSTRPVVESQLRLERTFAPLRKTTSSRISAMMMNGMTAIAMIPFTLPKIDPRSIRPHSSPGTLARKKAPHRRMPV